MSEQSFHLVCPHCQATNRVPATRLSAAPKCGKCGQLLLTASPHELNGQTTNKVIQKNKDNEGYYCVLALLYWQTQSKLQGSLAVVLSQ